MINHAGHTSSERLMNKKLSLTCIHTKSSVACGWNGWLLVARSIRDGETDRNTCGKRSGESEKENVCLKLSWRQPLVASELTWWYNPVDYNMPRVLRHIFSESVTSLIRYAGAGAAGTSASRENARFNDVRPWFQMQWPAHVTMWETGETFHREPSC